MSYSIQGLSSKINPIHGNLSKPPTHENRTITIFGKKIQVQHLIIAGTTAVVGIGSLLLGEQENEGNAQGSH